MIVFFIINTIKPCLYNSSVYILIFFFHKIKCIYGIYFFDLINVHKFVAHSVSLALTLSG